MFKKSFFFLMTLSLIMFQPASAQDAALEFAGMKWRVKAQKAEATTHLGREALALTKGRVWANETDFTDGVISFSAAYREHQVFIGAGWRSNGNGRLEEMYFRGHLNNKPDALQYTPTENGNSAWQIFSGPNDIVSVSQKYSGWNDVKIVVIGDKADIYFNSDEPVLHIPDLKTDQRSGLVALRSTGRNSETVYFSNVEIRSLGANDAIIGAPRKVADLPEGLIETWQVSSPFAEAIVKDALTLSQSHTQNLSWNSLKEETNGIANLSKLSRRSKDGDTVFIRMNITSDKTQMKEFTFGYSDRVRIYLNGKRVYSGIAGWKTRDHRFLGTVGFFDSVGLDLGAGENEILIAVSETFGGWAWAGSMQDQSGVVIK